MITKEQIRRIREGVAHYRPPVLTIYAHVNSAVPNNHPKGIVTRVKEALKGLDVPAELSARAMAKLESVIHDARTIALFANQQDMHLVTLEVDLPVVDPMTGHAEARWGEPYLAPLILALDEWERYAVVFVDRDRWRFFEVFLGEIEEIGNAFRPSTPKELEILEEVKQFHPAWIASRDNAERDRFDRHMLEWVHRFYREVTERTAGLVAERGIDRLILMGPDRETNYLETHFPKPLAERVVKRLSSLPSPDAPASEVYRKVKDVLAEVERRAEGQLLDTIRERGIWSLHKCLSALQLGQLHVVAVPWSADTQVFVETETGYVAADEEAARRHRPNGTKVEARSLRDVLPDLAYTFAARVEFMRGDTKNRLMRELGGMGGLRRW